MTASIFEGVLGNNSLYAEQYIKDIILLTKSVVLVSHSEANLYNNYIRMALPQYQVNNDKTTWRYYHHVAAKYHELDTMMEMVSWDSGEVIDITRANLVRHKVTKKELLKFESLYRSVVDAHPEQELLLKAILTQEEDVKLSDVVLMGNYGIVSYDQSKVEPQESGLIKELQLRIDNYSVSRTLPYYSIDESLYMATMYHVLYTFIVKSLLTIRLKAAKTPHAHSFHIKSYLASHHYLDEAYEYLTMEQKLFLYRNANYLDTHAGTEDVFRTLIDKLFSPRKTSVLNYEFKQGSEVDLNGDVGYAFKQKLLNRANLVIDPRDFTLKELGEKEATISVGNQREHTLRSSEINESLNLSLSSQLKTKDLEISLVDNSRDVKYSLWDALVDTWANSLRLKLAQYVVTYVDPTSGGNILLTAEDAFKLFTLLIHQVRGETITTFPPYYIDTVLRDNLPTVEAISRNFYRPSHYLRLQTEDMRFKAPTYNYIDTPFALGDLARSVYTYEFGLWVYLTNIGDLHMNAQLSMASEMLHCTAMYTQDTETVADFVRRVAFPTVVQLDSKSSFASLNSLLSTISGNLLDKLDQNRYTVASLVNVFKKFKSYSTQIIDSYTYSESILGLVGTPYTSVGVFSTANQMPIELGYVGVETFAKTSNRLPLVEYVDTLPGVTAYSEIRIEVGVVSTTDGGVYNTVPLEIPATVLDVTVDQPELTKPSQETLLFLAFK